MLFLLSKGSTHLALPWFFKSQENVATGRKLILIRASAIFDLACAKSTVWPADFHTLARRELSGTHLLLGFGFQRLHGISALAVNRGNQRDDQEHGNDRGDHCAYNNARERLLSLRSDAIGERRRKQAESRCHASHQDRAHLLHRPLAHGVKPRTMSLL